MNKYISYHCSLCGTNYSTEVVQYVCPNDGGNLDIIYDYAELSSNISVDDIVNSEEASLWRYIPILPVREPSGKGTPFYAAGGTPVYNVERLASSVGINNLWIKDESSNPTASFKDRASAVVVARAREIEAEVVVTASTGNAGAALAGMAAAVGQKAVIFAPKTAPQAKIAQLLIYGAQVLLVDGTYDDAFDLTIQASEEFGWYCRNTGYNPFTVEGKKTAALEIWQWSLDKPAWQSQMADTPAVFVSVGDGNIISGIHKGFKDLHKLGWLEKIPRIFGVQAEGSSAIANTFFSDSETIVPVSADTLADSISVDLPRDGVRAVRAARDTGGSYIIVSDEEILAAIPDLGKCGIFAEPAGAASYAGFVKAFNSGLLSIETPVMVLNTGSGLKDVGAALHAAAEAPVIEPSLEAVKAIVQ